MTPGTAAAVGGSSVAMPPCAKGRGATPVARASPADVAAAGAIGDAGRMIVDADLALARHLADAAAAAIRPHFRALAAVETKADASPVTIADRAAEAAIRAILARERTSDGVIGEEYGEDRPEAARVWVIDPIDGDAELHRRGGRCSAR